MKRLKNRRFQLESLEQRQMMTGDLGSTYELVDTKAAMVSSYEVSTDDGDATPQTDWTIPSEEVTTLTKKL